MTTSAFKPWEDLVDKHFADGDFENAVQTLLNACNHPELAEEAMNILDANDWCALIEKRNESREARQYEAFGMMMGGPMAMLNMRMMNQMYRKDDPAPKSASFKWEAINFTPEQLTIGVTVVATNYAWRRLWIELEVRATGLHCSGRYWSRAGGRESSGRHDFTLATAQFWEQVINALAQKGYKGLPSGVPVEVLIALLDPSGNRLQGISGTYSLASIVPDSVVLEGERQSEEDAEKERLDLEEKLRAAQEELERERRKSSTSQNEGPGDSVLAAFSELGLSPLATLEEVKSAHRRLAMQFHPDRTSTLPASQRDFCTARFKRIQNALAVLQQHLDG